MAKTSIPAVCFCLLMGIFCEPSFAQFFNAGYSDNDPWPEVAFEQFEAEILIADWEFAGFSGVQDICYEVMIDRCLWRYQLGEDYADPYELRIRAASANGLLTDYRSWMPDGSQRINKDEIYRASFDYDNTGAPPGEDNVELVVRLIKPDGTDGAILA